MTVMNVHGRIKAYKRDLRNLGLSDAEAHQIIPDASNRKSRKKPTDGGTSPGSGAPAPGTPAGTSGSAGNDGNNGGGHNNNHGGSGSAAG